MIRKYCFLFSILASITCYSQTSEIKRTYHWFFGDSCGVDFSGGTPVAVTNGALNTLEGCAAISDTSGNLLFYTDGVKVWTSANTQMPNGFGLNGHWSSEQSAVIVPKPGSDSIYYIFTTGAYAGVQGTNPSLCYSIVNMNLNGGLGSVTAKNIVLMDTATEHLGAVHHQNLQDVWIVSHEYNSDRFNSFLVTSAGVSTTPVISTAGIFLEGYWPGDWGPYAVGGMKLSASGCRLVCTYPNKDTLQIFNFDNISGSVSNPITIPHSFPWHACFSPNGRLLYVSCYVSTYPTDRIYQFNLVSNTQAGILASKTALAGNITGSGSTMQIAPDGKIYCTREYQGHYLAVINHPDIPGTSCNFVANGLYLGGKECLSGITNFVQSYFYNDTAEYFCTPVGIKETEMPDPLNIFPNPFSLTTTIRTGKIFKNATLTLFNSLGGEIKKIKNVSGSEYKFHRDNLSTGIYLIIMAQDNKIIMKGKLVIAD